MKLTNPLQSVSSGGRIMQNNIQHGKYQWDLVLDEATIKNDEAHGICESGFDTLTLTPNHKFVYTHFNSYTSEDISTGDCKADMKTMNLKGSVTADSADVWTCDIESSECRIGGPKELIGKFKVKGVPGNAVQITDVEVTDKEGKVYKYATAKLNKTKFDKKDK